MLKKVVSGLLVGRHYLTDIGRTEIKLELRKGYAYSLLTSENGNPVGYLDFGHSHNQDHYSLEPERGWFSSNGYVVDQRFSYYEDFDGMSGGFVAHSSSWGFFLNEQYRGRGIGSFMFSVAIGISRELARSRPLTRSDIERIDWEYFCGNQERGELELQKSHERSDWKMNPREAYFMVWRPMSDFYRKYFSDSSGHRRKGMEYVADYSTEGCYLVFPDFRIPFSSLSKRF